METRQEQIILSVRAASWSARAAELLAPAMPFSDVESLRVQVEADRAALFEVLAGGAVVGAYVLRTEVIAGRIEGVIVAAGADCPGVEVSTAILPIAEKQFSGVDAIRVHTARPGLLKRLAGAGYEFQEFVIRKKIK